MTKLFSVLVGIFAIHQAAAQNANVAERKSVLDKAVVSFKGVYAGPSLGSPNGYTADGKGVLNKKGQTLDSTLKLGYTVGPDLVAGVGINFDLLPFANQGASLKAPHLLLESKNIVTTKTFKWTGDLRFYLPVGDRAAMNATRFGARTTQTISYKLTPALSIASENMIRAWSFDSFGTGSRSDFEVRVSPFASYQFSDAWSATLWSDLLMMDHPLGATGGLQPRLANLQPGVRWDISRAVNINPFVNFLPGNMSIDTTTLGFVLNARLI